MQQADQSRPYSSALDPLSGEGLLGRVMDMGRPDWVPPRQGFLRTDFPATASHLEEAYRLIHNPFNLFDERVMREARAENNQFAVQQLHEMGEGFFQLSQAIYNAGNLSDLLCALAYFVRRGLQIVSTEVDVGNVAKSINWTAARWYRNANRDAMITQNSKTYNRAQEMFGKQTAQGPRPNPKPYNTGGQSGNGTNYNNGRQYGIKFCSICQSDSHYTSKCFRKNPRPDAAGPVGAGN